MKKSLLLTAAFVCFSIVFVSAQDAQTAPVTKKSDAVRVTNSTNVNTKKVETTTTTTKQPTAVKTTSQRTTPSGTTITKTTTTTTTTPVGADKKEVKKEVKTEVKTAPKDLKKNSSSSPKK